MDAICGDNRFEVIAKAKAHLLDATNIDTSEDEMKVLDNFLFRCWRMGWLKYFDEDENVWKMGQVIDCEDNPLIAFGDKLKFGTDYVEICGWRITSDGRLYKVNNEPQCDEHCKQTEVGCEQVDCAWQ